ncbi:MAG: TlyA family RNA methyltransferase, partial [Clostridia bacterium]|nr:TlyA family RNA methyltransferase [Clostridia bacterium]
LPVLRERLRDGGQAVCLIKPQFEAGKENVGKKGVVRDRKVHEDVIATITDFAVEAGFSLLGLTFSPIKGPEGNIEYLMFLERSDAPGRKTNMTAAALAEASHEALDR